MIQPFEAADPNVSGMGLDDFVRPWKNHLKGRLQGELPQNATTI